MPLLSLPDELLLKIAERLDRPDIIALRRLCRKLTKACSDQFSAQNFNSLRVDYDRVGLEKLVVITSQPHLLKKLDTISFEVIHLHIVGTAKHSFNGRTFTGFLSAPREKWEVESFFESSAVIRSQQEHLLGTETDLQLLQQAFKNLGAAEAFPTIAIKTAGPNVSRFASCGRLWNAGFTLRSILSASVESGAPVTKLDLLNYAQDHFLQESFNLSKDSLRSIGTGLTCLFIKLPRIGNSKEQPGRLALAELLHTAASLKELHVDMMDEGSDRSLDFLPANLVTRGLRSLKLEYALITRDSLIEILEHQRSSLRSLRLAGVVLSSEDDWRFVLRYLADSHDLTAVIFHSLRCPIREEDRGDRPHRVAVLAEDQDPRYRSNLRLRGRKEIKLRLHDIADNARWR